MPSIYKKSRDKGKKRSCWYFSYVDENGRRRTEKGFTDKGLTEQAAAKREHEVMLRKRGLINADEERMATQKNGPIGPHLDAFKDSISTPSNTDKHVKLTMSRVRKIVDGCRFRSLSEIDAEPAERFLLRAQADEDFGPRTYNHYVQAIDSLCNWCVRTKRLPSNPLAGMQRQNEEVDVRRERRALSPAEFCKLLESARNSGVSIQCYDGETRARIYLLSYMTGLRRQELASLTPLSFDLDASPPTLTVAASNSKHRRKDVLPLHPDLVDLLKDWLADLAPDQILFEKLAKRRTWLMVKKDLERVGIPYKDAQGRVADFHAAGRHTHITELFRNGASIVEAKELARHSDVKMTMKYTHIGLEDQAKAVSAIPTPLAAPKPAKDESAPSDDSGQRMGSASVGFDGHSVSPTVSEGGGEADPQKRQNPCRGKGFDADCQELSPIGTDDSEWRRRASVLRTQSPFQCSP